MSHNEDEKKQYLCQEERAGKNLPNVSEKMWKLKTKLKSKDSTTRKSRLTKSGKMTEKQSVLK